MTNWHLLKIQDTLSHLNSNQQNGLTQSEASTRLRESGANELVARGRRTALRLIGEQASTTMVLVLVGAATLSALLGDIQIAIWLLVIAALLILLGVAQEYRAEPAIAALQKTPAPNARVLRDGKWKDIPAPALVPGDVIQIEAGNVIPADARLLEAVNLRIQEAALTGESESIEKHTAALSSEDLPVSDRRNMAYMGSAVTQGRGLALVVATGMNTELGKIADLIQQVKQGKPPLHRRLETLARILAGIGAGIAALLFAIGLMRGAELRDLLLATVSVAVAIIPEALPAVAALALALGAQRMLQRQALIRALPAVETLGLVTVICSDKTGALTENRMTVVLLDVAEHALDLTEEIGRGGTLRATRGLGAPAQSSLSLAAIGGALCNDAKLIDTGDNRYHTLGEPAEGALVAAAAKMGYWKSSLDASFPRAAELPFDSERKRMTTVHHLEQYNPEFLSGLEVGNYRYIAFTKGSVDGLLDIASHIWVNGKSEKMDAAWKSKIEATRALLSKKGMRALAVGFRLLDSIPEIIQTDLEQRLTLVGLFGMIDPPRAEVKEAVAACRAAGIRPVMMTDDHPLTAIEIARQLGITENGRVVTGAEVEHLPLDELQNIVDEVSVFARIAPEHKLRIVQALQGKGHIVSMTGNSVNDAPALRQADIGAAMGITGADVSKEAADVVLLDDHFATLTAAVREGRGVYDNIRKFVGFAIAGNIGKALVMLLAPFLGSALLPLQLLWLNIVTDGLLGIGMSVENPEGDTMKRAPRSPAEGAFSRGAGAQVVWVGAMIGAMALALGAGYFLAGSAKWRTMIFTALAFMQTFHALASRSNQTSWFKMGAWTNPLLAGMALAVALLQMMVLYVPALARFLGVLPLAWQDIAIAIASGCLVFAAVEWAKKSKNTEF